MPLFEDFPYTNLQDLNLRWIIKEVLKAIQEVNNLSLSFNELKEYVLNFIKNLDIDEKIKEYFEALIETGDLDQLILDAFDNLDSRVDEVTNNVNALNNFPPNMTRYFDMEKIYDTGLSQVQGGTYVNGVFYITSRDSSNYIYMNIYNPNQPDNIVTIPLNVQGHAGSVYPYNGKLYITGGYSASQPTQLNRNIYEFDIATNQITNTFQILANVTGMFIIDIGTNTFMVVMTDGNALILYQLIDGAFYYYTTYDRVITSSGIQGGFADGKFIYDLRSYSGNESSRKQNGYHLIVYTWSGVPLTDIVIRGMDELEPEWIVKVDNTIYIGDYYGAIYKYDLNGELTQGWGYSIASPNRTGFVKVISQFHKSDLYPDVAGTYEQKVYASINHSQYNIGFGKIKILNNVAPLVINGNYLEASTNVTLSNLALNVTVSYQFNSTDNTFNLQGLRIRDLINDTYYGTIANAISFIENNTNQYLSKEIKLIDLNEALMSDRVAVTM